MIDPYYLKNEYFIDVKVRDGESIYAGKLHLTPKDCYIEIFTERETSDNFCFSETLTCSSNYPATTFKLFGLKLIYKSSTLLEVQETNQIWSLNIKFEIKYILISQMMNLDNKKVYSFSLKSNFLKKWTMHTKTQSEILNSLYKRDDSRNWNFIEFDQEIQNYGDIGIYYSTTEFTSIEELNAGIEIIPEMRMTFLNNLEMEDIYKEYLHLYQLLTVFNGSDFKVDTIEVQIDDWHPRSLAYLYFPSYQGEDKFNFTLLPLGKDIVFKLQELSTLPLNCFNTYYNLTEEKKELFKRYLNYKRLTSIEDKFLGYFRLLEKITFKKEPYVDKELLENLLDRAKSFVAKKLNTRNKTVKALNQRIIYMNQSKLNTEKCIGDFFNSIPEEILSTFKYGKNDLNKICKLRNDITHANDYIVTDSDLYQYTVFINSILFLAFINILEIPLETCIPIANRLNRI
ncbi:HEPN domain-containing protein [Acinetobacter nosocomialis]|uniref:HEPN domain-containing protein n=1 Tax=Acinetobacter nosocomialis TaxID=106654 RepID=UPI0024DE96E6|nr:HEPN domain-containing protein [Acinetobacter nosocomialis]